MHHVTCTVRHIFTPGGWGWGWGFIKYSNNGMWGVGNDEYIYFYFNFIFIFILSFFLAFLLFFLLSIHHLHQFNSIQSIQYPPLAGIGTEYMITL